MFSKSWRNRPGPIPIASAGPLQTRLLLDPGEPEVRSLASERSVLSTLDYCKGWLWEDYFGSPHLSFHLYIPIV